MEGLFAKQIASNVWAMWHSISPDFGKQMINMFCKSQCNLNVHFVNRLLFAVNAARGKKLHDAPY